MKCHVANGRTAPSRRAVALSLDSRRAREVRSSKLPQQPNHRVTPPSGPSATARPETVGALRAASARCFSH
jgi:hypothetical protein